MSPLSSLFFGFSICQAAQMNSGTDTSFGNVQAGGYKMNIDFKPFENDVEDSDRNDMTQADEVGVSKIQDPKPAAIDDSKDNAGKSVELQDLSPKSKEVSGSVTSSFDSSVCDVLYICASNLHAEETYGFKAMPKTFYLDRIQKKLEIEVRKLPRQERFKVKFEHALQKFQEYLNRGVFVEQKYYSCTKKQAWLRSLLREYNVTVYSSMQQMRELLKNLEKIMNKEDEHFVDFIAKTLGCDNDFAKKVFQKYLKQGEYLIRVEKYFKANESLSSDPKFFGKFKGEARRKQDFEDHLQNEMLSRFGGRRPTDSLWKEFHKFAEENIRGLCENQMIVPEYLNPETARKPMQPERSNGLFSFLFGGKAAPSADVKALADFSRVDKYIEELAFLKDGKIPSSEVRKYYATLIADEKSRIADDTNSSVLALGEMLATKLYAYYRALPPRGKTLRSFMTFLDRHQNLGREVEETIKMFHIREQEELTQQQGQKLQTLDERIEYLEEYRLY